MTTTTETTTDTDFEDFFQFTDTDFEPIECPYPEGSPEWEDFWVEQGA